MATVETHTRRVHFCAACTKPIHYKISHVEDPSVPMKDGSPSAFHPNCYAERTPESRARLAGFWPENAKAIKVAVRDAKGKPVHEDFPPLFEVTEVKEKKKRRETTTPAPEVKEGGE